MWLDPSRPIVRDLSDGYSELWALLPNLSRTEQLKLSHLLMGVSPYVVRKK